MMLVEASTRGVFEGGYEEGLRAEVHAGQAEKIPSEGVGRPASQQGTASTSHKTAFDPHREQEPGIWRDICIIFVSYLCHICVIFVSYLYVSHRNFYHICITFLN